MLKARDAKRFFAQAAQYRLSAERRWSGRSDIRDSGILATLTPEEIKRQEVCLSM